MLVTGNDRRGGDPRRCKDDRIGDPAFDLGIAQLTGKPDNLKRDRDDRCPLSNIVRPYRNKAGVPLPVDLRNLGYGDGGNKKLFRAFIDDLDRFLTGALPVLNPGPGINKICDANRLRYPG